MLGVRLDDETERRLAALARRTRRSKSEIAREAITRHVRAHDDAFDNEARRLCRLAAATDPLEWQELTAELSDAAISRHPG